MAADSRPAKARFLARVIIVSLCAAFVLLTFAPILWSVSTFLFPPGPVDSLVIDQYVSAAVDKRVAFSTAMFQAGLLVLAALWGLVFAEHARAYSALSEWPEVLMLLLATMALLSSAYSHFVFVWDMTSALATVQKFNNTIPDVNSMDVSYALFSQAFNLLGGAVIGGIMFASGRWLKSDRRDNLPPASL